MTQKFWSGKRDSNSRPQAWEACALPTELFPQIQAILRRLIHKIYTVRGHRLNSCANVLKLVQVDGNDVMPYPMKALKIAPGETYDVLVKKCRYGYFLLAPHESVLGDQRRY